jgi:hypothetical protein
MKQRFVLIFSLILTLATQFSSVRAAESFVYGFEDLPLMTGLSQVVGNSVLFDTPQGRIVQATAVGDVRQSSVLQFYAETLPQLGWTLVADAEFRREGETLRLEFTMLDQRLEVRFLVEPRAIQ